MVQNGSYRIPSVEHARVSDGMNKALVTCSPDIAGIVGWGEG